MCHRVPGTHTDYSQLTLIVPLGVQVRFFDSFTRSAKFSVKTAK
jgi:hypothetical protein